MSKKVKIYLKQKVKGKEDGKRNRLYCSIISSLNRSFNILMQISTNIEEKVSIQLATILDQFMLMHIF